MEKNWCRFFGKLIYINILTFKSQNKVFNQELKFVRSTDKMYFLVLNRKEPSASRRFTPFFLRCRDFALNCYIMYSKPTHIRKKIHS